MSQFVKLWKIMSRCYLSAMIETQLLSAFPNARDIGIAMAICKMTTSQPCSFILREKLFEKVFDGLCGAGL